MFLVCCISLLIERTLLQAIYNRIQAAVQQSSIIIARRYFADQIDGNIQTFAGSSIVTITTLIEQMHIEIGEIIQKEEYFVCSKIS